MCDKDFEFTSQSIASNVLGFYNPDIFLRCLWISFPKYFEPLEGKSLSPKFNKFRPCETICHDSSLRKLFT